MMCVVVRFRVQLAALVGMSYDTGASPERPSRHACLHVSNTHSAVRRVYFV